MTASNSDASSQVALQIAAADASAMQLAPDPTGTNVTLLADATTSGVFERYVRPSTGGTRNEVSAYVATS